MIKIGVPPRTPLLRIERAPHEFWDLWIAANVDFSQGTWLRLYDSGRVVRMTAQPDGHEDEMQVKGEDK